MVKDKLDVSIIIPARDEEKNIKKCLDAIFNQETPYKFEIVVIDSGSRDRTVEIVKQYPTVRLLSILPGEFGHGKTRNLGAQQTAGCHIVFLNADAIPVDKNWLNPLIRYLDEDQKKETAGVYSRHIPKPGCNLYMARDICKSMPETGCKRTGFHNLDFMIFSTVSCAVKREIWQKFPFEDTIVIAEDQEWARRVLENGFAIAYEPESKVFHSHNYPAKELYALKKKVAQTEHKFKNRLNAFILGIPFIIAGLIGKICGDVFYILLKRKNLPTGCPVEKMPFLMKIEQIRIAAAARAAGFAGRCAGWLKDKNE